LRLVNLKPNEFRSVRVSATEDVIAHVLSHSSHRIDCSTLVRPNYRLAGS